jgi:hypothetical protein
MTYDDDEIDAAIERIAGDVARRFNHTEFAGPAMAALLDELRRMEAARRGGDRAAASLLASSVAPALEGYRPTNATSRSKAVLGEVVTELMTPTEPPREE